MFLKNENFYHPFTKPFLGFGIDENHHHWHYSKNHSRFVLEDIDLYFQPVEDPVISVIYLVLGILITINVEFVHFKLFSLANRENGLVKEVTQIYSLAYMIIMPILLLCSSGTDFMHPLNEVVGQWFCTIARFFGGLLWYIVTFHSFVVAFMRYLFMVHEVKVQKYGKEKIKKVLSFLSFFVPLSVVIWGVVENAELDPFLHINRCYGIDHKVFLVDASPLEFFNPYYCRLEISDSEGAYGHFLGVIRHISCIAKAFVSILMGFNFVEGVIYYKIFSHIKR